MTIVEFFDHSPIENMVSCLANAPDKLIIVGERRMLEQHREGFYRFLDEIDNFQTVLEFRHIVRTSLSSIVQTLTQIAEENEDCHFDLTGGDDLSLVAVGIVYERFRDRGLQLHQYNIRTGRVYDCDCDGTVVCGDIPDITVEQNIILHGGGVVTAEQKRYGTVYWDFTPEFGRDLDAMWDICRQDCALWNYQTSMLGELEQLREADDPCRLRFYIPAARDLLARKGNTLNTDGILYRLERAGLIRNVGEDQAYFHLTYKNPQVKRCLTKAGTILELKTYLAAVQAQAADGSYLFSDAMTGVFIDWDGVVHDEDGPEADTENEVDVILMRGLIPIFISCKNGAVGDDELYKLHTVAERFGGAYAKKVLIGTTLGKTAESRRYFLARAKDMQITVIDGVQSMSEEAFAKAIRALAS